MSVAALLTTVSVNAQTATPAQRPVEPREVAVTNGGDVSAQAALAYWTPERLAEARPVPPPQPRKGSGDEIAEPSGPPGVLPSGPPAADSKATAVDSSTSAGGTESADGPSIAAAPACCIGGFPNNATPFDRFDFGNASGFSGGTFPMVTVGRTFFTLNGQNRTCSGSSIGNSGMWTAGHCVSNGSGGFASNVIFMPGYKNGAAPYGTFSCPTLWVATDWHVSANSRRDFGGAVCGTNGSGQTLSQAVGFLGFQWNWGYERHYSLWGYPVDPPFNGSSLQTCQSSFGHLDNLGVPGTGPLPFAIGCDLTGGISGGPYITVLKPGFVGNMNYVNGNAAYKYTNPNHPNDQYTPYYDDVAKAVRDCIVVGC